MKKEMIAKTFVILVGCVLMLPVFCLFSGSFFGSWELAYHLSAVLDNKDGYANWSLLPQYPSITSYKKLLLETPEFYAMFWNSIKITGGILLGQFIIAVPAAWGFSRMKGKLKNILFQIYIILMLMPFQVTMLSNYLTLNKVNLIDTQWSVILPVAFSTFPVFIIYRFFCNIPNTVIEAAEMDGAGKFLVFIAIGVPMGSSGIASALILGFFEAWNLVEQPLVFLKNQSLWPLSIYLPNIGLDMAGAAFAASIITLIPAVLVFLRGQDYLEQGIAVTTMKG